MKKQQVDHYGAHRSPNGLWFLIQNDEQNERGIANVKSNLEVKTHRNRAVSHAIRLGVLELPDDLAATTSWLSKDKLGKLLLPNPDNAGKVVFVEEDSRADIWHSSHLTTSLMPPVRQSWLMTPGEARAEYRLTNLQPFIITGVTPKWMTQHGSQFASLFRTGTRPVIFVGSSDVVLPVEVQERLKPRAFRRIRKHTPEQLRLIGSHFLQEWFRNARSND